MASVPTLIPVRQRFPEARVADVEDAMRRALEALCLQEKISPGMRVAITAGSRGITAIPRLLRTAADHIRTLGAQPIIVAAMGSHGGGTAEGQLAVLASLGVTPASVGCEVHGGVDVVDLGRTARGLAVYADAVAAACDAILVMNRVKPHTSFHGPLESGLLKMLVVGLGKPAGAAQFHSLGPDRLSSALAEIGAIMLAKLPVMGGIAILENGREEIAEIVSVSPAEMLSKEQVLLARAKELLPRLPLSQLDLLIVDEMGKDYSGTGMDTNVIGRMGIHGVPDGDPSIQRIVVLDLSGGSHGNANGMGLADFITERFRRKIDFHATYLNTLTATFVQRARMPIVMETDQVAIATALQTLRGRPQDRLRIARIHNTRMLEHLWLSPAALAETNDGADVEEAGPCQELRYDPDGNLT